jgi:hypothetical protein
MAQDNAKSITYHMIRSMLNNLNNQITIVEACASSL